LVGHEGIGVVGGGSGGKGSDRTRRSALLAISAAALVLGGDPRDALAVYNPLNLKGSYWETGKLYEKKPLSEELSSEPEELLESMRDMASALESLSLVVEGGKFDEASRMIRGGSVSESKLRIVGNALVDSILDDDGGYVASERVRVFLLNFDALDAAVTAAARRASVDGGLVSTLALSAVAPLSAANRVAKIAGEPQMGSDPRLEVLGSLEAAVKSLKAFINVAAKALETQQ